MIEKLPENLGVPVVKGLPPLDLGPALTMLRDKLNEVIELVNKLRQDAVARNASDIMHIVHMISKQEFELTRAEIEEGVKGMAPAGSEEMIMDALRMLFDDTGFLVVDDQGRIGTTDLGKALISRWPG